MLSLIGSVLGLIPGVLNFAERWQQNAYDAKVRIMAARIGGDVERAKQIVSLASTEAHEGTARLAVIAGNSILTLLVVAFAAPLVIFMWQVIVIDITVCGYGHFSFCHDTDPIRGQVADWANTIIVSIFGSGTAITLGKMIFANRSDK